MSGTTLQKVFKLDQNNTTATRELWGGTTTFFTMCYIIFVQPAILQACGMPGSAVMAATCIASATATLVMALYANYPIALAPAMGHNAFFAFTLCTALGYTWQEALAANFISGMFFLLLSFTKLREELLNAVPSCLKHGIAVGIGLLIAVIGLEWAGIVVDSPATYVTRGDLGDPAVLVAVTGLLVAVVALALKVPGALLFGILASTLMGLGLGLVKFQGVVQMPPSLQETAFKLDFTGLWSRGFGSLLAVVFVFLFLDLFDTIGTLIGVAHQAGFLDDEGRLPRAGRALVADAVGTVVGTLLGTSTVTSYIESSTGVAAGARTGLANIATAVLFLMSLFFYPIVAMVAGEYQIGPGVFVHPVISPVLILVGMFMMKGIGTIDWTDITEAFPAFMTIVIMPLTFSITEGISAGFVAYSLLKILKGKWGDSPAWIHFFSAMFIARYLLLATGLIRG